MLSGEIGERNLYHPDHLQSAASWIERQLRADGYSVRRQSFTVDTNAFRCLAGDAWNIEAILPGTNQPERNIVIGAHYDSKVATPGYHDHWPPIVDRPGTPGANDNASGVAALLALAKSLHAQPQGCTIRFVFFANEEPPFFCHHDAMGSYLYARELAANGAKVDAMISLETMGCYSIRPHHKRTWFAGIAGLPPQPDYVAFMSDISSWSKACQWATAYSANSPISARTFALPTRRVAWSDDWAFWQFSYPAFTITDTAFLRSDDYHELTDTADKLDYPTFANVVCGIERALRDLANQ